MREIMGALALAGFVCGASSTAAEPGYVYSGSFDVSQAGDYVEPAGNPGCWKRIDVPELRIGSDLPDAPEVSVMVRVNPLCTGNRVPNNGDVWTYANNLSAPYFCNFCVSDKAVWIRYKAYDEAAKNWSYFTTGDYLIVLNKHNATNGPGRNPDSRSDALDCELTTRGASLLQRCAQTQWSGR